MLESASGSGGAKAGILGGVFLAAAVGLFNEALLEAFKGSVLASLQTTAACTTPPTTTQDCFSTLLSAGIPISVVLPVVILGLLFGTLYGMYFEFLPGRGYWTRAVAIGLIMLIVMVFFRAGGLTGDATQGAIMYSFDALAIAGYAFIVARFYRRYTREVKFESTDPEKLKVTVDRKDCTGKTKTLSIHSTHKVSAPGGGAFHGWLVSGGVSVVDSKSAETSMRVEGDGLLKLS